MSLVANEDREQELKELQRMPLSTPIGQISRLQRVLDKDADYIVPEDMLAQPCEDDKTLTARLREAHDDCDEGRDFATTSRIEDWIDGSERRTWFLFEVSRREMTSGHWISPIFCAFVVRTAFTRVGHALADSMFRAARPGLHSASPRRPRERTGGARTDRTS